MFHCAHAVVHNIMRRYNWTGSTIDAGRHALRQRLCDAETGPLNYSHAIKPVVLAGICNCKTTPLFRPDSKFQSSYVVSQVYVDFIEQRMFYFGENKIESHFFVVRLLLHLYNAFR